MKRDFLKPLEVKTEEQVKILAEILSRPSRTIHLEKTEEEQQFLDRIIDTIKEMSNIDEETVDTINKAITKDATYFDIEGEQNT